MKRRHVRLSGDCSTGDTPDYDIRLPTRLFASGHYPNGRLNIYGKLDILTFLQDLLKGTPEFEMLRESCFGRLFDIPLNHCPVSCKVIHAMLARQVLTKQRYVLWSVFGGQPIRFGLEEFGTITGLPCGEFPEDYDYDDQPETEAEIDPFWRKLIGKDKDVTIADIGDMLQADPNMASGRKLRLALLMIVDGVLVATHQVHRPTLKYVQMLSDVEKFLDFPWGRESFLKTIACMKPASFVRSKQSKGKREDPVAVFTKQMLQTTVSLKGFPLVLQMLAYRSVPALLAKMPDWAPATTILDHTGVNIPKYPILSFFDVLEVESDPAVEVTSRIEIVREPDEGWGEWDDEVKDKKVEYMEDLIGKKHVFKVSDWPGGDSSVAVAVLPAKKAKASHKKHVVQRTGKNIAGTSHALAPKKTVGGKKVGSSRQQRRVSGYFRRPMLSDEQSNEWLVEEVKQLRVTVRELQLKSEKMEKKVKRVLLRRRVKVSRHWTSSVPRKRRRKDTVANTESGTPPSIRLSGMTSAMESSSGDETDSSAEEGIQTRGGDFDESPILTQQPPSSLPGSPDHEKAVRGGGDETDSSAEEGISPILTQQPRSSEASPDHEKADHFEADRDVAENEVEDMEGDDDKAEAGAIELERVITSIVNDELGESSSTPDEADLRKSVDGETDHKVVDRDCDVRDADVHDGVSAGLDGIPLDVLTTPVQTLHKPGMDKAMQSPSLQQMVLYSPKPIRRTYDPVCSYKVEELSEATVKADAVDSVSEVVAEDGKNDLVYVSDSSPAKRRERHGLTVKENLLCERLLRMKSCEDLLPVVEKDLFALFFDALSETASVEHVTAEDYTFSNQFLLNLAKPTQWISTLHMEILVSMANRKHKDILASGRAIFVSPWLINHLQGKFRSFSKAINKDLHHFDDRIADYVLADGKTWMKDIDTVYAPMIWSDSHWVGVVINLDTGSIEILDSQPSLKDAWKVAKLVEPVTHMLPYILSKLCGHKSRGMDPFSWVRVHGLYENERSGDCGPVAIKFMEIHCNGNPGECMSTMDDHSVDEFRKQYAVDMYKDYVLPCYFPSPCM